jgi:NTE family protein
MDIGQMPPRSSEHKPAKADWRPDGCKHIALVLQGGGALGAYQGGVYQALHEAGLEPDWVAGVSIGGINAAIIAGNPPERRLERLRAFWDLITSRPIDFGPVDGDHARKTRISWSASLTMALGQPGFFSTYVPGPWFSPRGGKQSTSFYDNKPLRETLLGLVDFDLINSGKTRFAVGAVNVANGNFSYFDNADAEIIPEHVMASGALPPALPMMQIGTDWYWDGGLVSNTPLQHLIDNIGDNNALVFQVDLFSARGPIPRDMYDVLARQKDIQYSSRTRLTTDRYMELFKLNKQLHRLLAKIPEQDLTDEERKLKYRLDRLPRLTLLHLIYQQAAYEGDAKDYEFSRTSMRDHWDSGYRDTKRTLRHRDWLQLPSEGSGIVMHDIHRADE